jgi:hypothetical protein
MAQRVAKAPEFLYDVGHDKIINKKVLNIPFLQSLTTNDP